jgi:hypothetical protein
MPKQRRVPKARNKKVLEFLLTTSRKCSPHQDKRRKLEDKFNKRSMKNIE